MGIWRRQSDVIWALSGARVEATTAAQTLVASYTMPGGMMGPNGAIEITMLLNGSSGATKCAVDVDFGSETSIISYDAGTADSSYIRHMIANQNDPAIQFAIAGGVTGWGNGSGYKSVTQDTDNDVDIEFYLRGDDSNIITLAHAYIKLVR